MRLHRRLEVILTKQARLDKVPNMASQISGCGGGVLPRPWKPITPISAYVITRLSLGLSTRGLLTFVVSFLRFYF